MRTQDLDICECGDYRRQHQKGRRRCEVCVPGDAYTGGLCAFFRRHLEANIEWKAV